MFGQQPAHSDLVQSQFPSGLSPKVGRFHDCAVIFLAHNGDGVQYRRVLVSKNNTQALCCDIPGGSLIFIVVNCFL